MVGLRCVQMNSYCLTGVVQLTLAPVVAFILANLLAFDESNCALYIVLDSWLSLDLVIRCSSPPVDRFMFDRDGLRKLSPISVL